MIEIYGAKEIERLEIAGASAAATLQAVAREIRAGLTTKAIDDFVVDDTIARGGECSQLNYRGSGERPFPASVCTSVNDVVCHGIPSEGVVLKDGDIVNVDVTTKIGGMHGDTSKTFCVGKVSAASLRLVTMTKIALQAGIDVVRHGARLSDIGAAIQEVADNAGYSVVNEFGGHGIGRHMHMDPHVCHARNTDRTRLKSGMAFTIEPMLVDGDATLRLQKDGWTVATSDGSRSAQFEHTLVVTTTGALVTTRSTDLLR